MAEGMDVPGDWREIHRRVMGDIAANGYNDIRTNSVSDPASFHALQDALGEAQRRLSQAREDLHRVHRRLVLDGSWTGQGVSGFDMQLRRLDLTLERDLEPLSGFMAELDRARYALESAVADLKRINYEMALAVRAEYERKFAEWQQAGFFRGLAPRQPWFTTDAGKVVYTPSAEGYEAIDQEQTRRYAEVYRRLVGEYQSVRDALSPPNAQITGGSAGGAGMGDAMPASFPELPSPDAVPALGTDPGAAAFDPASFPGPGVGSGVPGSALPGGAPLPGDLSAPPVAPLPGGGTLPGSAPLPGGGTLPGSAPLPGGASLPGDGTFAAPAVPGVDTTLPGSTSPGGGSATGPFATPVLPAAPAVPRPAGSGTSARRDPPALPTAPPLPGLPGSDDSRPGDLPGGGAATAPPVPSIPDDLVAPPAGGVPPTPGLPSLGGGLDQVSLPDAPDVPPPAFGAVPSGETADLGLPPGGGGLPALPDAPPVSGGFPAAGDPPALPELGSAGGGGPSALPEAPPVASSFPYAGDPPAPVESGLPGGAALAGAPPPAGSALGQGGLPAAGATGSGAMGAGYGGMPMMPMAPMAGAAGAGRNGEERERTTWLMEDRPIWEATSDGCAPAVVRTSQVEELPEDDTVPPVPVDPRVGPVQPGRSPHSTPTSGYARGY